jgi:hypothetical protein
MSFRSNRYQAERKMLVKRCPQRGRKAYPCGQSVKRRTKKNLPAEGFIRLLTDYHPSIDTD